MLLINNPFVTSGYIAPEYFCDREKETEELLRWLLNENNVAVISTRRMGKTGLIQHCFQLAEVKDHYYTSYRHLCNEDASRVCFSIGKSYSYCFKA